MSNKKKQRARELAFFILFSTDVGRHDLDDVLRGVLDSDEAEGLRKDIVEKVLAWKKNSDFIDRLIDTYLNKGTISNLASVAKAALRLGFSEMEYISDVPPEVVINEAVELAKTYGDPAIASFVNGVMDARFKALKSKKVTGNDKKRRKC